MSESELRQLLERATDRISGPDLATQALTGARRRLLRRRGAAVSVAGSLAVVAVVVVAIGSGNGPSAEHPPMQAPTQTPSVAPTEGVDEPPEAPGIASSVVQPVWDPRGLSTSLLRDDLALPAVLDPPSGALMLDASTVSAAVAAVDTGDDLALVASDGTWRRLDYPAEPLDVSWLRESTSLSSDGTRIGFAGVDGIWWRDVSGGDWRRVAYPFDTAAEWDLRFEFAGTEEVWVSGPRRSFAVDLSDGRAQELPFLLYNTATFYDTSVHVYVDEGGWRRLDEWSERSTLRRSTTIDALDSLTRPATDGQSLAAVRGGRVGGTGADPAMWDGLIALDLDGLSTRAYLPIRDGSSYYSDNLYLGALAWVDEDTVLGAVVPRGKDWAAGTQYLFTWNVETGEVARVSVLSADLRPVLATDLLRGP